MRWRWAALGAFAFIAMGSSAFAGNGSNYVQLLNGVDVFYGGKYNPPHPAGTMGIWRCIPADALHSPTMVIDPNGTVAPGQYAAKIDGFHFTACASTGALAIWPTLALSSSDGDCRITAGTGTALNFGFFSTAPFFGVGGMGYFGYGPFNSSSGLVKLEALVGNLQFAGPFQSGPSGALVYGIDLSFISFTGGLIGPSSLAIPEGESLTYWISENLSQGPGNYMYWAGSENEQNLCSSLSGIASAIGTPNGAVFRVPRNREFGMFVGTLDSTLMAAIAPNALQPANDTTMAAAVAGNNPMDTGTGSRTISLSGVQGLGGSGLGFETLSFNTYDEKNPFTSSGKLIFANLMAINSLAQPSCGSWSPGYLALPTGGPGGPTLTTAIPQHPRLVGKLDVVALQLISNPAWVLSTLHNDLANGSEYPMFPGYTATNGGSSGNTGGVAIPIPNVSALVGVQLLFSGLALNATNTAIAKTANNGHSHTNGFATTFFP